MNRAYPASTSKLNYMTLGTNQALRRTMTELLKGKRDGAHISVRCGGQGAAMIGCQASIVESGRSPEIVTLLALVMDYGTGDVCLFRSDSERSVAAPAVTPVARRAPRRRVQRQRMPVDHPWVHDEED